MNYVAEQVLKFKGTSDRLFTDTDYDFWFLSLKPYLESIGVHKYTLKGNRYALFVELPNGGVIRFSKRADFNDSLKSLYATDEALMFLYKDVYKTDRSGLLYMKEVDASITFIFNRYWGFNSVNVSNYNTYVCVEAMLKGMSAKDLIGKKISGEDKECVDFFYDFLTRGNIVYNVCSPTAFIEKAFGSFSIEKDSRGVKIMKAGRYPISIFTGIEWMRNRIISDWIMMRIPKKYRQLIDFI